MTVRLADVVTEMKTVLTTDPDMQPWVRSEKILGLATRFMLRALARDPDKGRVAVLMLVRDNQLTFAYPRHLARGNTLPVDRDSFAGRVVLHKEVLIENNVPEERHKDFFERIPDDNGKIQPIQKMIAAPLLRADGDAFGVVEISRTGATRAEAGPDFMAKDAENLSKCCQAFAPFIARTWTLNRGG